MTMLPDRRRQHLFQAKAREAMQGLDTEEHYYVGIRAVWYGEIVHGCECGFESHEKAEVLQHVEAENKEKP